MRDDYGQEIRLNWREILGIIIALVVFLFFMWFAGAMQEHYDCISGARPEVCIPADFE